MNGFMLIQAQGQELHDLERRLRRPRPQARRGGTHREVPAAQHPGAQRSRDPVRSARHRSRPGVCRVRRPARDDAGLRRGRQAGHLFPRIARRATPAHDPQTAPQRLPLPRLGGDAALLRRLPRPAAGRDAGNRREQDRARHATRCTPSTGSTTARTWHFSNRRTCRSSSRSSTTTTCTSRWKWAPRSLQPMLAKGRECNIEVRGPSDHGMIDSIYFRDPNGYVIELCAKRAEP